MSDPVVSIVVRTYNRPERLKVCLDSLADQSYRDFEAVVVNDAGSDVQPVIDSLADRLVCNYVSHETNRGRTVALNTGVTSARGRYVGFLDDDDIVYPDFLQTLVPKALESDLPVIYSDVKNVTFEQNPDTGEWKRVLEHLTYSFDFERNNFLLGNYIPVNCLLIRRDCFDEVGLFDPTLTVFEDWDFLIRLSRKHDFVHIAKITGEYRRWDDNSNMVERERYHEAGEIIRERYKNERNEIFDEVFKSTFSLKREMRKKDESIQQLSWQLRQATARLAEAGQLAARQQEEIRVLKQQIAKNDTTRTDQKNSQDRDSNESSRQ
ncbi:MAG: glycosyltransferase [bacterium]